MAKQTFTTGQVLTAAQMTDLQQTAMTGGAASTKTVSYVLVAADAGTRIAMNAAGSTTITVNTSLFSAGDTVSIQNIGAGVCTITAGTATVNTSGSLVLSQYQGGILYFTSASTAIFFQFAVPVASSGAYTSIASGNLSGVSSVTISSISQDYKDLYLVCFNPVAASGRIGLRVNGDTGSNYQYWKVELDTNAGVGSGAVAVINVGIDITSATNWTYSFYIENYATTSYKPITVHHRKNNTANSTSGWAHYNSSSAYTSLTIVNTDAVNYTSGTYTLYGVK